LLSALPLAPVVDEEALVPDEPEVPAASEELDVPELFGEPDEPDVPDVPGVPDDVLPDVSEDPDPGEPEEPDEPDEPDEPEESDEPDVDTPAAPAEVPLVPEVAVEVSFCPVGLALPALFSCVMPVASLDDWVWVCAYTLGAPNSIASEAIPSMRLSIFRCCILILLRERDGNSQRNPSLGWCRLIGNLYARQAFPLQGPCKSSNYRVMSEETTEQWKKLQVALSAKGRPHAKRCCSLLLIGNGQAKKMPKHSLWQTSAGFHRQTSMQHGWITSNVAAL
jgi:hypothetical protein